MDNGGGGGEGGAGKEVEFLLNITFLSPGTLVFYCVKTYSVYT